MLMFAINHAATALIIKKTYATVPMIWILISVQIMELLWVILNFIGLERTTTDKEVRYVGNIHLTEMPYSHSIITMLGAAVMSWFVLSQGLGWPDIGAAFGLGIISHIILDLITHDRDIPIAPFAKGPKFGLGLYARHPVPAFFVEIGYGLLCWSIYGGSWMLLVTIVVFNLVNLSMFFRTIPGIERIMVDKPRLLVSVIFLQIIITLVLIGVLS
jgi:hypothetical protein